MRILIKNVEILDLNNEGITKGYITIVNEKISGITEHEPYNFDADAIIDGKGKLAVPGLINSHSHIPMTLLRSYADDMNLEKWLFNKIFPIESKLNGEDVYWAGMLGIAEMIKSGTTTFCDMYYFESDVARAAVDSGIRACLTGSSMKFSNDDVEGSNRLYDNIELFNNYNNKEGRISVLISAHSVYTCTPEYLKECYAAAKELHTGLHIHLSETKTEVDNCLKMYGNTPIEHCYNLGILDDKVVAAHCVHPTDREINIIKETGVNIVHNPTSNLKLGSGIAPISKYIEKEINVALGTDGASSNNNLNMFEEMHLAGIIHKGYNENAEIIKANEVLKMATVNGAKALGINDIGDLKEGNKADIILIDLDKPHLYPRHNMLSNLVYSAQGGDVDTVIVNGKILLQNGEFATIDFEQIKYNVDRIYNRIFE